MAEFDRIKLIANPVAGKGAREKTERAAQLLRSRGGEVDLYFTRAAGDGEREAAETIGQGYSLVIAAGGDGTLNEVLNGIHGSTLPVSFLPLGTTNVFALEIGMPFAVERACAKILGGQIEKVYLGRVNGRLFSLMVSAGYDAETVHQVSGRLKKRIGKGAYLVSALQQLWSYRFPRFRVSDGAGRSVEGCGVVISKARCYGGSFVLTPDASIREPSLEVCVMTRSGRLAMLTYSLCMVLRRPFPEKMATLFRSCSVEIEGVGVAVQVDGDEFPRTPVTVTLEPEPVYLVLP
ncbi:MAG: diacylglycerol kinase family lipid kinase [Desulfuromonadales bacterium]|nr:diacylglycerol kinase family lipid kinase [Desulfuromonadales bacterium]